MTGDPTADTARSPLAPVVDQWPVSDDDLTRRVAAADLHDGSGEDREPNEPETTVTPNAYASSVGEDGSIAGAAVATSIDMDWDEDDEPPTNMRDEMPSDLPPRSVASDFEPVVHVPAAMPEPFSQPQAVGARASAFPPAPVRSSFPQPGASHDWREDAATQLSTGTAVPSYAPSFPAPRYAEPTGEAARARAHTEDRELESQSKLRGSLPWLALAAVLAVGVALGVRSMMAPPALATVTLVTEPADAEVSVDGRPLVGQASPFTIQGLAPEAEHSLVVRKAGHAERTLSFQVEPGETKLLPTITLESVRIDTGVALSSEPAGARVLIDGTAHAGTTPLRVTDLAPGLHKVRIEHGDGFSPYETEIAVAAGQVIELPIARLVPSAAGQSEDDSRVSRAEQRRAERRAARRERRAERRAARASSAPRAAKSVAAASAPAVAGGGTLRVNSRPWAQVYVDGKLVGNTPQLGIPLKAGKHTLKLVNPELKLTKQVPVNVGAGQTVTKVVNLIE